MLHCLTLLCKSNVREQQDRFFSHQGCIGYAPVLDNRGFPQLEKRLWLVQPNSAIQCSSPEEYPREVREPLESVGLTYGCLRIYGGLSSSFYKTKDIQQRFLIFSLLFHFVMGEIMEDDLENSRDVVS